MRPTALDSVRIHSQPPSLKSNRTSASRGKGGKEKSDDEDRRFSTRCFCTIFLFSMIFITIIGLLVVIPLVSHIISSMHNKKESGDTGVYESNFHRRSSELIDPNTPNDKKQITTHTGQTWDLVFSDEFNENGRKFNKGQDPFWEGVDLWYEPTGDLEYYHPDQITTNDGNLVITLEEKAVGELKYSSGMLQSWNKLCFQGGRLEVRVSLPGSPKISGLWPGAWTLGNLGRAGYKATTDGIWPYSYDTCDTGVKANQSLTTNLSHLPGQRLNSCVCSGQDHPNPGHGRGAPEIDLIESTAHPSGAEVSQSLQVAPFDTGLTAKMSETTIFRPGGETIHNSYKGSPLQQSVSALTKLPEDIYDGNDYKVFAIEYEMGDDGYITWFVGDTPTWKVKADAIGANSESKVEKRMIPEEPMYIILNLAISKSFSKDIDFSQLPLPAKFLIDYVRLYQPPDAKKVGCSPSSHPTKEYIEQHRNAYYNKNFTNWAGAGYKTPTYSVPRKC